jgi:hypothetical protein
VLALLPLTPRLSGVFGDGQRGETVETVPNAVPALCTPLKRGVNQSTHFVRKKFVVHPGGPGMPRFSRKDLASALQNV